MKALDKLVGCCHGAACGKHIVMNHYDIIGSNGIAVNLDYVGTVLFGILHADGVGRELAGLSCRYETRSDFISEDRAADEAARFDADNFCNAFVAVELREVPANNVESPRVLENSGKVFENDSFGREINHVADF